ncbi:MAG: hypothetical protein KAU03_00485 [Candidatus Altiarchaeales archaeon]|nr:hypothetical protein [Candidatus Altiarchaeales archaeon]
MLHVKDRDLVMPGHFIGDGINLCENCFREGDQVYSSVQGMVRVGKSKVRVIPSAGTYLPREMDVIVGVITEVTRGGWILDINFPCICRLGAEEVAENALSGDLTKYFDVGDNISAKISSVNEVYSTKIIRPWKLVGGVIMEVNPKRIPRVVGKKRSMLDILKKKTGCSIVVGQNGRIWVKGGNITLAVETIKMIEREAQMRGLTDRVSMLLDENQDKKVIKNGKE